MSTTDLLCRRAAFHRLEELQRRHGDVLPLWAIKEGFEYNGSRVLLLSQARGIFKPKQMTLPLSVTTVPPSSRKPRPYDDVLGADGVVQYRYQGTDPQSHDNRWLRDVMLRQLPLIYFHGIVPGKYVATYPVFVVGDEPEHSTFRLQVDHAAGIGQLRGNSVIEEGCGPPEIEPRRRFCTVVAKRRLQQASFRERILHAYRSQCAVCRLRHEPLLDAAHIVPFAAHGSNRVSNGLALCRLHHGAFDTGILGIHPDLRVEVAPSILEEEDGPMLRHGLQGVHGADIHVPRSVVDRPDPDALAQRYDEFLQGIGA